MKKFLIAAMLGGLLGVVVAPQLAGPLLAKETDQAKTYKQLELFGDIFDRMGRKHRVIGKIATARGCCFIGDDDRVLMTFKRHLIGVIFEL